MLEDNITSLLIVDDDPIYRRLVHKLLRPWKIEISSASSVAQAKKIFEMHPFDLCFVDGYLGDGEGLDFVQWMSQQTPILPKIALITAGEFDDIQELRKTHPIEFLLHKPINRHELTQVIQAMLNPQVEEELSEDEAFIEELRQGYENSIPQKLDRISDAIEVLVDTQDIQLSQQFAEILENIAENAIQFGYARVHQIARDKIEDIEVQQENWPPQPIWFQSLNNFFAQLKNCFQLKQIRNIDHQLYSGEQLSASNPNIVYLVSPQLDTYPRITQSLKDAGATIIWESRPEAALRYLLEEHFDGALLVVAERFPNSFMSGSELIDKFRSNQNAEHTISVLVASPDPSLSHSGHFTIQENLSPAFLVEFFLHNLNPGVFEPWNILNATGSDKLSNIIQSDDQYPIVIETIDELPDFTSPSFVEHTPDLICLQANYEHLDWLQRIDQVAWMNFTNVWVFGPAIGALPQYNNLEVSWFTEADIRRPLILPLLKQYIKSHRMHAAIRTQEEHTELYTRAAFTELFHVSFSRCTRFKLPMNLVMLDVHALHRLNDNPDHFESHQWVKQIGQFFKSQFRRNDIICRWHGSIFAFFFEGIQPRTTQFIMNKLIKSYQTWDAPFTTDLEMKLSVGVAHYPEYGDNYSALIENALIALEHAQSSKTSKTVLAKELPELDHYGQHQHKILLVDSNEDVKTMLSYGFGLRGYDVKSLTTGGQAIELLRERSTWGLPDLIILDRELQDMDGVDVLEQIRHERLCSAPIVFLSSKSTEEQILRGLKAGAVDYFVKPFSMDIFVAKCQKILGIQ